jgi:plastocyanin
MKHHLVAGTVLVIGLASSGCGGSTNGGGSAGPTTPSGTAATTITIVSSNGLGNLGVNSFSPNPASVSQGTAVEWRNADSTTHHIVLDDGSLDTGNLAPGASAVVPLTTGGGAYHCTIHPTMVGSINGTPTPSPGPNPGY